MIGWLWRMIVGSFHQHVWETVRQVDLIDDRDLRIGQVISLRCTKCGDWKRRKLA